jgi:hypothetical protein
MSTMISFNLKWKRSQLLRLIYRQLDGAGGNLSMAFKARLLRQWTETVAGRARPLLL